MDVFLSFSGSISHQTAQVLEWWLPKVIQQLVPFLSSEDIDKGTRWGGELAEMLDTHSFGIICVNRQNVSAPWINFETGALAKSVKKSRVAPFLLGLDKAEIRANTPLGACHSDIDNFLSIFTAPSGASCAGRSPCTRLVLFQATSYDKQDVKRLLNTFNNALEGGRLTPDALDEAFDMWWPRLQERLDPLEEEAKQLTEPQPQPVGVTNDDMLEEILELTREQRRLRSSLSSTVIRYIGSELWDLGYAFENFLQSIDGELMGEEKGQCKTMIERLYKFAYQLREGRQIPNEMGDIDPDQQV